MSIQSCNTGRKLFGNILGYVLADGFGASNGFQIAEAKFLGIGRPIINHITFLDLTGKGLAHCIANGEPVKIFFRETVKKPMHMPRNPIGMEFWNQKKLDGEMMIPVIVSNPLRQIFMELLQIGSIILRLIQCSSEKPIPRIAERILKDSISGTNKIFL